ncbi:3'-5' exonuclease [Candidatus Viadribacter manganicus]|uniref:Exonuclease domain-containing protein n=1 Tax=Candidatus Viadribacter manganicus TaxID=1759059 RepID=A0A1B1AHM8_9PROT|nr:3'-5' exonuclease [Candidatus Viadribacter manganicus]ANP46064.1 hypothetical protein ATE48_09090 [Candidatus Viadribacter manganicus]
MRTVFLDTETTGLNPPADGLVEIAIVEDTGRVLLNSLVNPERTIGFASTIHGITDDMVATAPRLLDLLPQVEAIVCGARVVIYNSGFDTRFFPDRLRSAAAIDCAMLRFARARGVRNPRFGDFKWHKLTVAAEHVGYEWEGVAHRALADALATRAVWNWMEARSLDRRAAIA